MVVRNNGSEQTSFWQIPPDPGENFSVSRARLANAASRPKLLRRRVLDYIECPASNSSASFIDEGKEPPNTHSFFRIPVDNRSITSGL